MQSPQGPNLSLLKKLFVEVQKESRSFLYDLSQKEYKNNKLKQIVWAEIAESLELPSESFFLLEDEVQVLWKRTRNKYKAALAKSILPSGSARRPQKQMDLFLLQEMDFLRPFIEDAEQAMSISDAIPTSTNYTDANTQRIQHLFDEMATDPEVIDCSMDESSSTPIIRKKPKSVDSTKDIEASLQRLEGIATKILATPRDPFYSYFETEMEKLSDPVKAEFKSQFITQIYEAQKNKDF
ncbi:PREDICTED: uncharacterized protein LOC108373153 [Rhagoletis zephyria]|uniref:uncharacterized protein LOC108373153 n=1 Tax=Rhagoletis zephyria TaxID=28612 RepID=UPI0008116FC5|nr:PREDICTED: uncharacterized protein LOC108373153 [Rhagoletis zephyria]